MLRAFTLDDAPAVQTLCSEKEIAATTLSIPHPYPPDGASEWIAQRLDPEHEGNGVSYAVIEHAGGELVGSVGLWIKPEHKRAELGYWIGKPYWGRGYASEAAQTLVCYGFEQLELNRIFAHHMKKNPQSGRVMQKIGMAPEGELPEHVFKWDAFEDLVLYGITRSRYDELQRQ